MSLCLAAAIAIPLAFNPWGYNAFELPKTLLLRLIVLLMALAGTFQVLNSSHVKGRRQRIPRRLLWPALALALALALATAFSVNPRASLWGSYERQQGLITRICYLLIFLATASSLTNRAQFDRLWSATVWTSAPVVVYGLLQAAGIDPLGWRSDATSPVLSTVGRANFLGSYLVLVIPLTLARVTTADRRWPAAALLAAQGACLALTQARGAWVGLGAALTAFGLLWGLSSQKRRLVIATVVAAGLVVTFVALLNVPEGPLAPLARVPGFDRLAALSRTDTGSTAARITIWRATLPLIAERPWLGYGPDTMRVVFARVFPPELVYYQGRHAVVDRAHNLWLDLGMSAGLAGGLAFIALVVGCVRHAWQGVRASEERWQWIAWTALAAAVAGHLADLQFSFDLTTSATVFWLILGMAGALGRGLVEEPYAGQISEVLPDASTSEKTPKTSEVFVKLGNPLLVLPPTAAALVLAALVCARPLLADAAFWRSQQAERPPEERQTAAARAVRLWPLETIYRLGLAGSYAEDGDFVAAEAQLVAAERFSPDDPRVWSARGDLYTAWGRYTDAEAAYRRVLELAPNVATYHAALGVILARQGRLEEGITALERAVALDATDGVAYGYLADLYAAVGQNEKAAWARREAERWQAESQD